jgi:hypothetical protein
MNTILPGVNRRLFLSRSALGLGGVALASLSGRASPQPAAKAKRVISLFMSGGPSHLELVDDKPLLTKMQGQEIPDSVRGGQRLTGMSGFQSSLPLVGSFAKFSRHGKGGATVSELLPHLAKIADDLTFVKSVQTDAINHDPAITLCQTGHQLPGRPSFGSWLSYGLGSANENLPTFVVLVTKGPAEQGLYARLWGNAFLESRHQGVQFRAGKDPVLYLKNPAGVSAESRRKMLDRFAELHAASDEPDAASRVTEYEMAYRMQSSVPGVMDFASEPASVLDAYGPDAKTPGTFAANCLLARRLAERGVRFIQLYHPGWDQHGGLPGAIRKQATAVDRPSAALVADLKRLGMLDETLVAWGGEFGRTAYTQGKLTPGNYGRDHHPRCFTMWFAGGGMRPGVTHGATDDFGYNVAENPVHVHDVHATMLHLLGIDHEKLTFKFQGRHYRLTDVHGHVVTPILA